MNITLDYWIPYQYPEGWKQDPNGMDIDMSEDNLGGETEEDLGQITGMPRKGDATDNSGPKTVRSTQQ